MQRVIDQGDLLRMQDNRRLMDASARDPGQSRGTLRPGRCSIGYDRAQRRGNDHRARRRGWWLVRLLDQWVIHRGFLGRVRGARLHRHHKAADGCRLGRTNQHLVVTGASDFRNTAIASASGLVSTANSAPGHRWRQDAPSGAVRS